MEKLENEEIFVQSDELDRITHSLTASHKHRKHSSVMVTVPDLTSDLGSIPGHVSNFFANSFVLNSSN